MTVGILQYRLASIRSLVQYSPSTLSLLYPSRSQRLVPQLLSPPLPSNYSETRPMVGAAPRIFKPWDPHVVAASCTFLQSPHFLLVETRSLVLASAELADHFSH